jgi:hypothetical protein
LLVVPIDARESGEPSMALHRVTEIIKRPRLLFRRVRVFGEARMLAKRAVQNVSKAVWKVPLDRERTVLMLEGYEISVTRDGVVLLPQRQPVAGDSPPALGQYEITFEPEYVWRLERDERIRSLRIASSGTILLNNKLLLDTDFGSLPGISDLPSRRRRVDVDMAILPWSHKWATYYEFVLHILLKLCRIKEAIDPSSWATARVCYPMLHTRYERQYLQLLGLSEDAVLDTRKDVNLVPRSVVTSNLQSGSRLPSPTGMGGLRRAFLGEAQRPRSRGRGLYLSRARGERQVRNEMEVRRLVSSYGLEVVESVPASVTEQIRMFSEAPLIVSPHGSALTNLVWCAPGTRVIELFSRGFTPPMYAYMSQVLGLPYACLVDNARQEYHWTNMHKDMVVDVASLAKAIEGS